MQCNTYQRALPSRFDRARSGGCVPVANSCSNVGKSSISESLAPLGCHHRVVFGSTGV